MAAIDDTLGALAEAVADGAAIDWDMAVLQAADPDEQRVVVQLRQLAAAHYLAREGRTWGSLEIVAEIGRGSFGTVYRARDPRLDREVALKLLANGAPHAADTGIIREGRLLARVRHPNVVTVHGADRFGDRVGIWMELVAGRTLKEIVEQQGAFGPHEAALIGRDLCRALAAVHHVGLVHGDLKAQNVMREAGGRIVLMDFGAGDVVATASDAAGPLVGTPAYLAPEILAGQPAGVRGDIYALGVLLYYLVTGRFPVEAGSLDDLRALHAHGAHTLLRDIRPDLPEAFVRAVDRATAVRPEERPESAGGMERLLDRALEGEPAAAESAAARPSTVSHARLEWRFVAVAVVAAVAIAGLVWSNRDRRPVPTGVTGQVHRDSVAILPFTTDGGGADEYLGAGITQEVVAHLASLRDVRVIAGASTLRYRAEKASPEAIGAALGVATVLDGRVEQTSDRLRITTRLLDAGSAEPLWTDISERPLAEIYAMQVEVSRKIALALRGELSAADMERFNVTAGDSEAFTLYLKGRYNASLRSESGLNLAITQYEQAVLKDGHFAPAYAGLAEAYFSLGTYGVVPRSEAFARAATAAQKAIALDDSLPEAHAVLGYAHKNRFAWADAEAGFKRAIQLSPGYAAGHHWYSIYLTQRGRFPEAITEIKAALALDPLSIGANLQLAGLLMMAHRYEDAIAQWQHTIRMDGGFVSAYRGIATSYAYLGLHQKADEAMQQAVAHANPGSEDQELKADRAYVLALAGRRTEAQQIVRELETRQERTGEALAGSIAAIYTGLGEREQAFAWLARACEARDPEVGFLGVDPRWDPLRSDVRFAGLLRTVGLESSPSAIQAGAADERTP